MTVQDKIGLVFAGGNGNASYQIGAWQALQEAGLTKSIVAVSGSSMGALHAMFFALDTMETVADIWLSGRIGKSILNYPVGRLNEIYELLRTSGLSHLSLEQFAHRFGHGLLPFDAVKELYQEIDFRAATALEHVYITTTKFPGVGAAYVDMFHYPAEMRPALLTSALTLPVLAPTMHYADGSVYWDGGISDIVPVRPLYEEASLRSIIVLHLSNMTSIQQSDYPCAEIIELKPTLMAMDRIGELDFTRSGLEKRIQYGKSEMEKLLIRAGF